MCVELAITATAVSSFSIACSVLLQKSWRHLGMAACRQLYRCITFLANEEVDLQCVIYCMLFQLLTQHFPRLHGVITSFFQRLFHAWLLHLLSNGEELHKVETVDTAKSLILYPMAHSSSAPMPYMLANDTLIGGALSRWGECGRTKAQ